MASFEPKFRRGVSGRLLVSDTPEAKAIRDEHRERHVARARLPAATRKAALEKVKKLGGDINNTKHLLGCMVMEFGCFRGETFKWLLENSPGYPGYIVYGMQKDKEEPTDGRWVNKMGLRNYTKMWAEGSELIDIKRKEIEERNKKKISASPIPVPIKDVSQTAQAGTSEMPDDDEDFLLAIQEHEQMTADVPATKLSCVTTVTASQIPQFLSSTKGDRVATGIQTSRSVPVLLSRDVVPTVSAQRKALLSGACLPVKKPSPTPSIFKKTSSAPSMLKKPSPTTVQNPPPAPLTALKPTVPTPGVRVTSQSMTEAPSLQEVGGLLPSSLPLPASDSGLQLPVTQQTVDTQSVDQTDTNSQQINNDLCLPARWKTTLRKVDQEWISKALFRRTPAGKAQLVPEHLDQLWWYPPQPDLGCNYKPGEDKYFARPLFLWMPRKQFRVELHCPQPDCKKQQLVSAGINQKVRQVTDIDGFYNMACDNLDCLKCKRRVLSWSHAILSQLDIGHRVQFPCILTAKRACDIKVVRLLRNRGLGNSCSQLQKKLQEQHGEKWLQNTITYLTDCSGFLMGTSVFAEPPDRAPVPTHKWLMQVYIQDVLLRLDEMKAGITSVFGRILKIDSTKKIVKKLAGRPAKTALWCTNLGNEHGQILTSVMTTGEGHANTPMMVGVINRYTKAQVSPPEIIYLDCDCCGDSPLQLVLTASAWNTILRLDIWHFMRRIATGCTTNSHQLYSSFMGYLSNCIFHWDEQDLSLLIQSKRNELEAQHVSIKADADIMKHLSRYELARHCRRKTRGVTETTTLISKLIETFGGERGRDTLGVPLINSSRMASIWNANKKHIACIQDPVDVTLYTKIGSTKKGGIELPNFRCARGSTSLESFHLHLNRFIPGTLASDVLFQAYMVDGLHRWNDDRGRAATSTATDHQSYSGLLRHTANVLAMKVLKRKIAPTYNEPSKYTGEHIGIEYLYNQTGKVMEDYKKAIETLETTQDDITTDENEELLQDTDQMDDLTVSNVGLTESSDIVLEIPTIVPMPQEAVQPHPLVSTETQALESVLNIPTAEVYEEMMSDTVHSQATEPIDQVPIPVVQEESFGEAVGEEILDESESEPIDQVPIPVVQEESFGEAVGEEILDESESEESVGPDNIPGYDRVQELAAYLICLRDQNYLTNAQVDHLGQLWKDLPEYDKKPTVFPERFSEKDTGRFKAKKTVRNVVPGVESTERSMRGGPCSIPASWPNANRYTEAIFIQLLSILPRKRSSLDDAARAYNNIRQLVLLNGRLPSLAKIQLPEISRGTLLQWNTKRGKGMDKLVLTQGVRFEQPSQTTSLGVPSAVEKPVKLLTGRTEPHTFICPTNTAGLANLHGRKRKRVSKQSTSTLAQTTVTSNAPQLTDSSTAAQPIRPVIALQTSAPVSSSQSTCHHPAQQSTPAKQSAIPVRTTPVVPPRTVNIDGQSYQLTPSSQAVTSTTVPSDVPYTTQMARQRRINKEKEGVTKRKYTRTKVPTCKKCGQERTEPTHTNYFMNWFCSVNSTISFEDWKHELKKKEYGRKPRKKKKKQSDDERETPPPGPSPLNTDRDSDDN